MQQQEAPGKQKRMEKRALPPAASQLAEAHRLGRFTVYYTFTDYTASGCMSALFFYSISGLIFSTSIFLALYAIRAGVIIVLLFGVIPMLVLAWWVAKRALNADDGDSATAYFYQQGLVYLHKEQHVVLRWEQIERVDLMNGLVRCCRIVLADGESIFLMNGQGGNLSQEIKRRVMRFRKKHQQREEPAQ